MNVNPITGGDVWRRAADGLPVFDDEGIGWNTRDRKFMSDPILVVEANNPIRIAYNRRLGKRRQRGGTIITGMHDNKPLNHQYRQ